MEDTIDFDGLAALLRVDRRTLSRWIKSGWIPEPDYHVGRQMIWERKKLQSSLKRSVNKKPSSPPAHQAVAARAGSCRYG